MRFLERCHDHFGLHDGEGGPPRADADCGVGYCWVEGCSGGGGGELFVGRHVEGVVVMRWN